MIKLDYSLTNIQDRIDLVNKILEETPNPSNAYLEILSTYIIVPIEKEERKAQKKKEHREINLPQKIRTWCFNRFQQ